jgi:hypothetical protein
MLVWRVDGSVLGETVLGPFAGTAALVDGGHLWVGGWPTINSAAIALTHTEHLSHLDAGVLARRVWRGRS